MNEILAGFQNVLVRTAGAIQDELYRNNDFRSDLQPVVSMILNTLDEQPAPAHPELYYFGEREASFVRGSNEHAFVQFLMAETEDVRERCRAQAEELWAENEALKAAADPFVAALAELVRAHFEPSVAEVKA